MALPDQAARRRIREDLDATLFVEAAAGTGKTTALVERVVALLMDGRARLEQIVAVTFTEKAAGEMKLRLRGAIERERTAPAVGEPVRRRLEAALEQLEVAKITTIHAFCADLLRERPVEAGVDPLFEIAPEDVSSRLLDAAFERWFQAVLEDPPEGVRRILRRRARGPDAMGPRELLRGGVATLVGHRDFEAPWRREPFARDGELDAALDALTELAALGSRADQPRDDWLAKNLLELQRYVDENRLREAVSGRDHDALEAGLRELLRSRQVHWHWRGSPRMRFSRDLERAHVIERRNLFRDRLELLLEAADADLAACLQRELRPVVDAYEDAKAKVGRLDFLDLLLRARDLVKGDRAVREDLRARFTHFFVDEFQDTDPLQAELLLLLASADASLDDWRRVVPEPGKLFLVGDPKQSIYRFRRADPELYLEVRRRLEAAGVETLHLSRSFRSVPSLQEAVNDAFAPAFAGAGSTPEYVPLERAREELPPQPTATVVSLPVPQPKSDWGRIVAWRIDESFPDAVGAFVHWLIEESGWEVTERSEADGPERRVPVASRHVCLLFRRFRRFRDDVTRPYVRALEARHVPHVLVGGRSFHDREEVIALRNAVAAIEWPEDELRVFATLRGPFFALTDDVLLAWRHAVGSGALHPLRRIPPEVAEKFGPTEAEVAEALAVLERLHRARNRRPIAETLTRLLEAVRAHAGLAVWPTGEQALANVLRSVERARRFERGGAASFRAFVEALEDEAERAEVEEAPVVEEGTEGVRIMTVHRAKGLEFPVVILCDPTCRATRDTPTRHVDPTAGLWAEPLCGCVPHDLRDAQEEERERDAREALRLAYVAATRARDLLVLPVVVDPDRLDLGTIPEPVAASWLGALHEIAYDPARRFDLGRLTLDVEEEVGLRQQRILEADEAGAPGAAAESIRAYREWREERGRALAAGAEPSLAVESVTALARRESPPELSLPSVEQRVVEIDRSARPGGTRFGTLVHATLAAVDLAADAAEVWRVTDLQARILGSPADEAAAAAGAVEAALADPLLRRAASSPDLRREVPVALRLDDEASTLVEGVIDLAFLEDGGWVVVDFKTDRELAEERREQEYALQVGLYARAVAEATDAPVQAVLLRV